MLITYIETLVNYNREEGKTTLAAQGWVNELNVAEESTPTNATNNEEPDVANWAGETGLKALTSRLLGKVYHTFMIKPHVAVFKTGKCLVPGVQIDLELLLNDSNINMFLFGTPDTTTSVDKKIPTLGDDGLYVTLWMKKVTQNASVYARLQKERSLRKTKKVKYPVVRSEIRTYSFDGNSTRWKQDNLFVRRVPGKVMIGLLNSNNYNGTLNCYSYAYEKFGVTCVRQTIDGEEYLYRASELTGNSGAEDLVGYDRFLTASGAYKHHKPPMLLPSD
ncbi:unnamed protein product [Porites evermanni]|uniref:Uncharacterized protein n=1 Tax=Porites evermanni TaxID=104178 RepID=A0ABN8LJ67_9CNID|nr:unnamed protein product [Porites evermanni]